MEVGVVRRQDSVAERQRAERVTMLNRRQAPGAARGLRRDAPPLIARGARHQTVHRTEHRREAASHGVREPAVFSPPADMGLSGMSPRHVSFSARFESLQGSTNRLQNTEGERLDLCLQTVFSTIQPGMKLVGLARTVIVLFHGFMASPLAAWKASIRCHEPAFSN